MGCCVYGHLLGHPCKTNTEVKFSFLSSLTSSASTLQKETALDNRVRSERLKLSPGTFMILQKTTAHEGVGTVPWRLSSLVSAHQVLTTLPKLEPHTFKGKRFLFSCLQRESTGFARSCLVKLVPEDFNRRTKTIKKQKKDFGIQKLGKHFMVSTSPGDS